MRMETAFIILFAVLCAAVAGAGELVNGTRVPRSTLLFHSHHMNNMEEDHEHEMAWKRALWREMQALLRADAPQGYVECCPSVLEMVAPKGGGTPNGLFVELFEDGENKQQLYELSCAPGVVGKPCRFVDARLYNQSRCVQKYSYSYALVRSPAATEGPLPARRRREGHFSVPGAGGWSMDYVRVRAGCECQLAPRRKPAHRRQRHRGRRRNRRLDEDDDT